MASVFVSHSSRDRGQAQKVSERLRAAGLGAQFLDFDPVNGIPAGRVWERELYAQLRKADAVVFVATPHSVASRWCMVELALARSLGRPVFPVLVAGTQRHPLLADVQWIDATSDGDLAWARLLDGLRLAGVDPRDSFTWDPTRSPYPGLEPFAVEDAAVFFGRDQEIASLLEALQPTVQRDRGRFVAVVGPSGSGKSSLVRAGLLPRLQRQTSRWVIVPPMVPGGAPTAQLARSLARAFAARGRPLAREDIEAGLRQGSALAGLAQDLCDLAPGQPRAVLVFV
ncbi:MAG: toll/interleukin-1 receptor domain-containing protein, partial [Actinomycetota bacterium]|nr:toll/interleukin-1 receptor domain-containing protein [Actinomycetota bacterium]